MTLYSLLVIYQCLLCYLLIGFLKTNDCHDCNSDAHGLGSENVDNNDGKNHQLTTDRN